MLNVPVKLGTAVVVLGGIIAAMGWAIVHALMRATFMTMGDVPQEWWPPVLAFCAGALMTLIAGYATLVVVERMHVNRHRLR